MFEVIAAVLLDPDGDAAGRMDAQGGKEWSTSVPVHAKICEVMFEGTKLEPFMKPHSRMN